MWQDIVIAIVGFLFGFILLPLLRDVWRGDSTNIYTAGLTTIGLYVLAATFFTMRYWLSFTADLFQGQYGFCCSYFLYYTKREVQNNE